MRKLLQGIIDYHRHRRPAYKEIFARLALGQQPDALLIACSDSRVAPNVFASTEPGDVFVLRNVGNMVPAQAEAAGCSEHAALEFAVRQLEVLDIIVCGHSSCGAMRALLAPEAVVPPLPHLQGWLHHGRAALEHLRAGAAIDASLPEVDQLSQLNVLLQLEHLRGYAEAAERIERGRLRLHGWWFDIGNAEVLDFDPTAGAFRVIDESRGAELLTRFAGAPG